MLICKTVIDLSRLVVFYCPSAFTPPDLRSRFLEALFKASEWTMPWTTPIPKHRETNNEADRARCGKNTVGEQAKGDDRLCRLSLN